MKIMQAESEGTEAKTNCFSYISLYLFILLHIIHYKIYIGKAKARGLNGSLFFPLRQSYVVFTT